jgi:hypothetical protein
LLSTSVVASGERKRPAFPVWWKSLVRAAPKVQALKPANQLEFSGEAIAGFADDRQTGDDAKSNDVRKFCAK